MEEGGLDWLEVWLEKGLVIGRLGLVRGVCDIRKVWFGRRRFGLVRGLVRESV